MIENFPDEIWKDIKGYEGIYKISNLGRIKSLEKIKYCGHKNSKPQIIKERLIKPNKETKYAKDGNIQYIRYRVKLYKDNKSKTYTLARLVAEAFIPNPNNLDTVDHIDKDTSNNRVSNLRWLSREDNSKDHRIDNRNTVRKIRCIEKDIIFNSIREASKFINICEQAIGKAANPKDRHKTAGGYHWEYIN